MFVTRLTPTLRAARHVRHASHLPGAELLSPVWTHGTDILVDHAKGSWLFGADGKKYQKERKKKEKKREEKYRTLVTFWESCEKRKK